MPKEEGDVKTFENPRKPWNYEGSYTIELSEGVNNFGDNHKDLDVKGRIVQVTHGRFRSNPVGFMFYCLAYPFGLTESNVNCIRDGSGELLWVNPRLC